MTPLHLNPGDRSTLLSVARLTLQTYVKTTHLPEITLQRPGVCQEAGAAVALSVLGQRRGRAVALESAGPLYQTIMDLTVQAADDPDRRPIEPEELHQVQIEIGILQEVYPVRDPAEIQIGRHGLALKGEHSTLLLPETAVENGWTPTQFLQALYTNAGLPEPIPGGSTTALRVALDIIREE